jgi:NAD(P)-dependent dehydrogenase (short-subunit alcohol dehydrogenase family)
VLVNNAGIYLWYPVTEVSYEQWQDAVGTVAPGYVETEMAAPDLFSACEGPLLRHPAAEPGE